MSDSRSPRVDRYKRRPRSVLTGEQDWSSAPPDAEPMYPPGWSLESELRERRPEGSRAPRAAPPPPERPTAPTPKAPTGPTGPPPRPDRPSSPHERDSADRGPSNRQLLRRALSSPRATKQAFLLREVLGPPVALRTDRGDRPS